MHAFYVWMGCATLLPPTRFHYPIPAIQHKKYLNYWLSFSFTTGHFLHVGNLHT